MGKSYSPIKKGTIVWYWNRHLKKWKKGKVIAVNRWGLVIQERQLKRRLVGDGGVYCIPASEPKPTHTPFSSYAERVSYNDLYRGDPKKVRFLKRMGVIR